MYPFTIQDGQDSCETPQNILRMEDQAPKKPKISKTLWRFSWSSTPAPILGNSSHYLQDFWKKPPGGFLIQISEVNLNTSKKSPQKTARCPIWKCFWICTVDWRYYLNLKKPSQKSVFEKNNLKIYQLHNLFGFEV